VPTRPLRRLLIANRGEIAVRIVRAARDLGLECVAVCAEDDTTGAWVTMADDAVGLAGVGPAAYLDVAAVVGAATSSGCDALHPGYGFLSEQARLAEACAAAGVTFVGPDPAVLAALGDKVAARRLAERAGVPVVPATDRAVSAAEAASFLAATGGPIVLKAVHGGGGRGMRVVGDAVELADAHTRASSEALAAFGSGDVYAEALVRRPRHVEVQILGDGTGAVTALGDRDCTLQRRHQKVVEIAPAPGLAPELRAALARAAVSMGTAVRYSGAATLEFLVEPDGHWYFIEANARLQVEHTVTEEVTGVDLVQVQLLLAAGATLAELGLDGAAPPPRGWAIQARVCLEQLEADGSIRPTGGTIATLTVPSGPGVRVDTFATPGYRTNPRYDSLLAKVIATAPGEHPGAALGRLDRALGELEVGGVETNAALLRAILTHDDVTAGRIHTRWIDEHAAELVSTPEPVAAVPTAGSGRAGVQVDSVDPLAVLDHGRTAPVMPAQHTPIEGDAIAAPVQGTVVAIDVVPGAVVQAGQPLAVMEAMKMEHVVTAPRAGTIVAVRVTVGEAVYEGAPLFAFEPSGDDTAVADHHEHIDLDHIRPDLAETLHRHALNEDDARPDAVARRRAAGQRTARENVADLCDPGSFVEYGPLVLAAQRRRRSTAELIEKTPADGLVGGVGSVNGTSFGDRGRCVVMSYDYTVLAGTQGNQNHRKKDRLFELAKELLLPVVLFTEGGGGRPGDTDGLSAAGLDCLAFRYFAELSGLVPLVGINSGYCFAGNAALLGCCDVVIATANSNIGMGGPAMIEGGGLGVFHPSEVGPMDVQVGNGVVDLAVADEAAAVAMAKRYLSYFQGDLPAGECADQRLLRHAVPENRLRIYDVRQVIETLCDTGSVLELRPSFGLGMVTALARIDGRAIGVVANNPSHLAGAIDSDGADKAARFLQLCDAFDLPVLLLCDTPGIMVGPEVEKTALVRHAARLFVTSASLSVPAMTIVLRKGYGLGAQAMAAASFKAPLFCVSWPTGEFGGMGLEGAVKLGYRNELAAIDDPAERKRTFEGMVQRMYEHGKALNFATHFEIDDVIDPADSRRWITMALAASPRPARRTTKKRACVDTW
jgi:acetyl/propionyl-CoA carboxylase alpha subunit/acetyl-CoA carboxylase carboxyltransferase component